VDVAALSLSDAEFAALRSAEFDGLPAIEGKAKVEEQETVRSSHLRFPPRDSGLKIPRSLFLASRNSRSRGAGEVGGNAVAEEDVLRAQGEEMVRLMRRSIVLHEFKERVLWDEDAEPHRSSEERVQLACLDDHVIEEKVVGPWLEDGDN
jgi:hypothetical protein